MPHAPYSPDLSPPDFWLFNGLKKHLRGRKFSSPEEIDREVFEYFDSIAKEEWRSVFNKWIHRMKRCIEVKGDYFEQLMAAIQKRDKRT
jgi:histone-lysine N-methyltransferase SETMAR